jgi:hypothetical protein
MRQKEFYERLNADIKIDKVDYSLLEGHWYPAEKFGFDGVGAMFKHILPRLGNGDV